MVLTIIFLLTSSINLSVKDNPDDAGGTIVVEWEPLKESIDGYVLFRYLADPEDQKRLVDLQGKLTAGTITSEERQEYLFLKEGKQGFLLTPKVNHYLDENVKDGIRYQYSIGVISGPDTLFTDRSAIATSSPQLFHKGRINVLLGVLIFTIILLYFLSIARKGKKLFVRRITGLNAVEDAVGRATEMGRPILYIPGLAPISFTGTIASMNILSEISKRTARYETPIKVANRDPVVYTITKEVVKESYTTVGRPDLFQEDYVVYLTQDQFGFAAAVDGLMMREKPSTNFFIGYFWAESLLLAEIGAATGAIQIAGTDAVHQLPFFITACDFCLIGEELYAASAYLSQDPVLLSALKAQDYGKALITSLLILSSVVGLTFWPTVVNLFQIK